MRRSPHQRHKVQDHEFVIGRQPLTPARAALFRCCHRKVVATAEVETQERTGSLEAAARPPWSCWCGQSGVPIAGIAENNDQQIWNGFEVFGPQRSSLGAVRGGFGVCRARPPPYNLLTTVRGIVTWARLRSYSYYLGWHPLALLGPTGGGEVGMDGSRWEVPTSRTQYWLTWSSTSQVRCAWGPPAKVTVASVFWGTQLNTTHIGRMGGGN